MKTTSSNRTNLFKNIGLTGIALCAICCALPIAGAIFSIGTLTIIASYFEWAAITVMAVALVVFIIWMVRKKRAPTCDVDCSCKTENSTGIEPL
jgi:uncharacterized membrane protein